MEANSGRPDRLVLLADEALLDLANIDNATASAWGVDQADRYVEFLSTQMRRLAEMPHLGNLIQERPTFRTYVAKFRGSRWSNGHRILFQEIPEGILVVRILHTRMNWPEHLPKDR